ncbi:MAG: hypothetical protein ACXACY_25420 [Candidatus Hodarchaeales archaeon]|jgi:hypothetical protein
MIISENKGPFGAKVSIVSNDLFTATISTAKEGLFKGLSTMVIDGRYPSGRPCAKITYTQSSRKKDRIQFHNLVVAGIDGGGDEGKELGECIQLVINYLKDKGVITEGINLG